jgi:arylsulfatase A-like enzyme
VWSFVEPGQPWQACDMSYVWAQFVTFRQAAETGHKRDAWFAYLHLFEVHEPYLGQEVPFLSLVEEPARSHLLQGRFSPLMDLETGVLDLPDSALEYVRKCYRAYCQYTDERLAPLWKKMLDGDTLLVIVSDHGDSHGEEGVWGHGRPEVYQTEAARQVLLGVVGPGVCDGFFWPLPSDTNAILPTMAGYYLRKGGVPVALSGVEERLRELGYLG